MSKPFTLQVQDTEKGIVELLNTSQLPTFVIKQILQDIFKEVEKIEQEEIRKYEEKNKKKESEK